MGESTVVKRKYESRGESIAAKVRRCDATIGANFSTDKLEGQHEIMQKLDALENNFKEFQDTMIAQLRILAEKITDNSTMLKSLIQEKAFVQELKIRLPLETEDEIKQMENDIFDENMEAYVTSVHHLIRPGGLIKNFTKIIGNEIIINYNLDGNHGKKSFKEYRKLLQVLEKVFYKTNSEGDFTKQLRKAFHASKNKHYKRITIDRQKEKENSSNDRIAD